MFCINCGQELPEDANFCHKCGSPQTKHDPSASNEPVWETCEIVYQAVRHPIFGNSDLQFRAKAIGPNGAYTAGESPIFKAEGNRRAAQLPGIYNRNEAIEALDVLINTLAKDGWEFVSSNSWYKKRFRRRIK